ncbi:aliphatic sulfonate ABC transporter substrate-binding protein [Geobacillus sp. BMUD]|uniref:aliphatic sulfonate ABC transporter substrate-binding protein n=1 Tax=Geobacillus sp. BMUD TaxID=2508876 RepID=UPI001491C2DF|nr:aliphatic sulfonate ABC transporter substrate-binding protein [Geobacillus sp. BMUD]NNU83213.1 aliphatic sulfonate ABC transporter substrate-binding protein [Geobacillus sp. BMUD]
MKKRFSWLLGFSAFVCLLLAACGQERSTSSSASKGAASVDSWPEELHIGYQKSSFSLFLKEKGYLEKQLQKHGVQVKWFEFQSGPPLLEALNSGQIDIGYVGGAPAILAQANPHSQLAYIAYEPEVARAIIVPKTSSIHTVADLKGKKVAFGKGSSAHYTLLTALETAGLTLNDITPVYLQPAEARTAFERGDVDAWVIWDPFLADAEVNGGARILIDANRLPKQYGFIVARNQYVKQYANVAKTVIDQLNHVHQEIHSSPDEAAKLLAKETKIDAAVWKRTLSRRGYGVFPLTKEVIAAQQRIADQFYKAGLVSKRVNVNEAVVFVKEERKTK